VARGPSQFDRGVLRHRHDRARCAGAVRAHR
jgi:hypothetical protein